MHGGTALSLLAIAPQADHWGEPTHIHPFAAASTEASIPCPADRVRQTELRLDPMQRHLHTCPSEATRRRILCCSLASPRHPPKQLRLDPHIVSHKDQHSRTYNNSTGAVQPIYIS